MTPFKKMITTRNLGGFDRFLRMLPTPVVAYLMYQGQLQGVAAWSLGIIAFMFLVTTVTGSCSVYYMLGLSTCPVSDKLRQN